MTFTPNFTFRTVSSLFLALSLTLVSGCAQSQDSTRAGNGAIVDSANLPQVQPNAESSGVSKGIMAFASRFHFAERDIDNQLALESAQSYVDFLDTGKNYLLAEQVGNFYAEAGTSGSQWIRNGNLSPAYTLYNDFVVSLHERSQWVAEQLEGTLDLEMGGEVIIDPDDRNFANTQAELDENWLRRLASETIQLMLDNKLSQREAQDKLITRYEGIERRLLQRRPDEVFQTWMNAQLSTFGPHTTYFSPRTKEDFDINMSLSLDGIGARLSQVDDLVTIIEIIPGGPAEKSNQLAPRDKIVAVAQGENGDFVDVVGWRVNDVVELIRGERGSVVRLTVESQGGNKVVKLVRDKIDLQAQAAKSELKTVTDDSGQEHAVGVIELPAFYSDFSSNSGERRSSSVDVKQEVEKLVNQGAEGILLDLRGNGGGSLDEAIKIAAIFLPQGSPVVQVQSSDGNKQIYRTDAGPSYRGPLAVLTDRLSASASEILAGVIQDTGRGLVIGQTTFGKGTVQNLIGLQRFLNTGNTGQVKITTAKFYRVSGGSNQHKGVVPDIVLPSLLNKAEIGESSEDNALPWSQINPALYQPSQISQSLLNQLQANTDARQQNSAGFSVLNQEIDRAEYFQERETLPVSLSARRQLDEQEKAQQLAIENAWRVLEGKPTLSELEIETDEDRLIRSAEEEDRADPWLDEALNILWDYVHTS